MPRLLAVESKPHTLVFIHNDEGQLSAFTVNNVCIAISRAITPTGAAAGTAAAGAAATTSTAAAGTAADNRDSRARHHNRSSRGMDRCLNSKNICYASIGCCANIGRCVSKGSSIASHKHSQGQITRINRIRFLGSLNPISGQATTRSEGSRMQAVMLTKGELVEGTGDLLKLSWTSRSRRFSACVQGLGARRGSRPVQSSLQNKAITVLVAVAGSGMGKQIQTCSNISLNVSTAL